jgi:hypothetical protein
MLGLAVTDGNFIVGDGSTWVVESGATARTSLGITDSTSPDAAGDFVIGETASSSVSVSFPFHGAPIINGKLSLSVAGSILTVALKGLNGSDPSASNPVFVSVADGSNAFAGTYSLRKVTSALSVAISNGSTLGHSNAVASAVYFYVIDNAGTLELAASSRYFGLDAITDSTTEGGAGGADSRTLLYSTTARTSVAITCLMRWKSTQTNAGVWAAVTGEQQLAPFPYKTPTVQVLTSNSTYTLPWDALRVVVEVVGGGGGGGGADSDGGSGFAGGGGGGGGGYARETIRADLLAPTETASIGAAGTAGSGTGGTTGGTGGTSSLGSLLSATGGVGGTGTGVAAGVNAIQAGGAGGAGSGGEVNCEGQDGTFGVGISNPVTIGGHGGSSVLGGGGAPAAVGASVTAAAGSAGNPYGGGGGGAANANTTSGQPGGAGAIGVVIVSEFYA